eukprot:11291841-Alexandrium_andersonii.AAC.1
MMRSMSPSQVPGLRAGACMATRTASALRRLRLAHEIRAIAICSRTAPKAAAVPPTHGPTTAPGQ